MTPKTKKAPLTQKEFRAALRRIDANLKEIKSLGQKGKEMDRKMAPLVRELRKIADE